MIFLVGFQQQNNIHGHYILAACQSFLIAGAQFALYKGVMAADLWGVLEMGAGGAIGITLSMYLHRLMRRKYGRDTRQTTGETFYRSSATLGGDTHEREASRRQSLQTTD